MRQRLLVSGTLRPFSPGLSHSPNGISRDRSLALPVRPSFCSQKHTHLGRSVRASHSELVGRSAPQKDHGGGGGGRQSMILIIVVQTSHGACHENSLRGHPSLSSSPPVTSIPSTPSTYTQLPFDPQTYHSSHNPLLFLLLFLAHNSSVFLATFDSRPLRPA